MADQICVKCKHSRRSHSRRKCEEYINERTGQECPCKVKFMDHDDFR